MSIFNLNIPKLVRQLLPTMLRKPLLIALLNALTSGINSLFGRFSRHRNANLYSVNHTPQVQSLEHLLNDRYDNTERRIYITDGAYRNPLFIYRAVELRDMYLYLGNETGSNGESLSLPLYQENEIGFIDESFIVHIPASLASLAEEMRVIINAYKLTGRHFTIVTF